ncbi:FecR family protein [Fibrella forsythiae]|uniref:FecR domain-containing protein n=1 Tax=Fibrella forsythiae TaxID=2817061 RepID=A0ABS3JCH1_9BACT|nr:FecR domain-containing protein [Fibrella forsythiae]MBO0947708.1 FecR domain-containing protein [Fibrella forsythiae]
MKYANYQVEDFLTDTDFIRWVKSPQPQQDLFWEAFQREHPEQQPTLRQARAILLAMRFSEDTVSESTIKAEWDRFVQNRTTLVTEPAEVPVIQLRPFRRWWAAAAAVAGLLIGFLWWTNQPVPDTVYRTAFGQLRQITLPDGSALTLNANSEARVPGNWRDRPLREVWLRGEGFFHVVKRKGQSQSRFVVHTDELAVEVLGTSFNVKSRRKQADVLLQEGSVRLRLAGSDTVRSLLMRPGDGVHYQPATGRLKRLAMLPTRMAAWTRGVLLLDYMTLAELGSVIEDTYGRKVVIRSPALARRVLSGSVPTGNERALLDGIALTLNVPVHMENNTVVFGN